MIESLLPPFHLVLLLLVQPTQGSANGGFVSVAMIAAGLFTIAGAFGNWDWFFNNYKARFFVSLFGRDGARVFYALLGLAITLGAIFISFGG